MLRIMCRDDNQKGFSSILLILVLIILTVGVGAFYLYKSNIKSTEDTIIKNLNESSQKSQSNPSETIDIALKNFEASKSYQIDFTNNVDLRIPGNSEIYTSSILSGFSETDLIDKSYRFYMEARNPRDPSYKFSTETIVLYNDALFFLKRDDIGGWAKVDLKTLSSSTSNPPDLAETSVILQSIIKDSVVEIKPGEDANLKHLQAKLDPEVFYKLYPPSEENNNDVYKDTKVKIDIWINDKDNSLVKLIYSIKGGRLSITSGDYILDSNTSMSYSKYNQDLAITKPTEQVIKLEDLRKTKPAVAKFAEESASKYKRSNL